jgi:salicylate hydroxylase
MQDLKIAIVGAGLGGLTTAAALNMLGYDVDVYEQAAELGEIGAGLSLPPNSTRVLEYLGLKDALAEFGNIPDRTIVKHFKSGEVLLTRPRERYLEKYGCNYYFTHRADVHDLLAKLVQENNPTGIHTGRAVCDVVDHGSRVEITFSNGDTATADLVIGCDGIHSVVRDMLFEPEPPYFTNQVAYRSLVPWNQLNADTRVDLASIDDSAVMTVGPDHWINLYPARRNELVNCVAMVRTAAWHEEGWSNRADISEILSEFEEFHDEVQTVLRAIPPDTSYKWGMFVRKPLSRWSAGRVILLGDAAHGMLNFLGQGAAMAIEDAMVLARCIKESDDHAEAFLRYEKARVARTHLVQVESDARGARLQTHKPDDYDNKAHRNDEDLGLFDYNAMTVPI